MNEMKFLHLFCFVLALSCAFSLKFQEYKRFLEAQSKNETFVKLFHQHMKKFNRAHKSTVFPCKAIKSQKEATSVHELTPSDIKVIAAIGDSLTAGTGITAKTPIGLLREDRGLSWSGGGDGTIDEHVTMANMLKRYNQDLVGFAVGSGSYEEENAHLNVANPGNEAKNMPFQANLLVQRIKSGKEGVNITNDWKLITMFIGGNDLCNYCTDMPEYTVEKYVGYITQALDILHKELPKTFVNVVETLNIGNVPLLNEGLVCNTLHYFTCRCGAFPRSKEDKKELNALVASYQKGLRDLVASGRYDTRDDFTVVDQPFFSKTKIPVNPDNTTNLDYFAPDCFHLSELGQEAAANALWDNMIEPVGQKRPYWRPGEPVDCPSDEKPYFYTMKNSPPANGLGSGYEEPEQGFNDQKGSSQLNQINATSVASTIIGVLCLVVLVSGTVYIIKRKRNNVEKDHLLTGLSSNYTKI